MKIYWKTLLKKCNTDKDLFPFGIRFYDGVMGSGKTLSMLADLYHLADEYKDLMIISNIIIKKKGIKYYYFNNTNELISLLNEGVKHLHTIVLIDEGLSYFAENGGIDPALMSTITQSRKNRMLIMIATQKFKRLNNRIRDFSSETVQCRCYFNRFQWNIVRDDTELIFDKDKMDFVGVKKYSYIFKRNNELFNSYDTKQKIDITQNTSNLFVQRGSPIATLAQDDKRTIVGRRRTI